MTSHRGHKLDVSLEALADLQVPGDISISPDGTRLVYSLQAYSKKGEHATSSIWIAQIGVENSSRQLTSGLFHDEQPHWSPAGGIIAFKSDRHRPGQSSAIYLMSIEGGGEAYAVTPAEAEKPIVAFQWNATGTEIAFTSADEKTDEQAAREKAKDDPTVWGLHLEYHRLRIVNVASRQVRTIVSGRKHVHDFTWSPDAQVICFVAHKDPDINSPWLHGATVSFVQPSGKELHKTAHFPGLISQLRWGHEGVYFIAGHVPEHILTSLSLYKLDLEACTYTEHQDGDERHCCITIRNSRSCLSYRVQRSLADEFYLIDGGAHTLVFHDKCEMIAFDLVKTPDNGTVLAMTKGDGSHPEEIYSISEPAGLVRLSAHNSSIAALGISRSWSFSTHAADEYSLDGMMYVPSTYDVADGPLPTILIPHGGPYWRITTGFAVCHCLEAPVLVSQGYAVLCPNYRGGSSRGEEHAAYAHGGVGTVDYTDCIDVLRHAIDKGWVDPSRVVIGGWSQGGFLSYFAATRADFQFRGAICGAGISEWTSMAMRSDAFRMQAELVGGAPWDVQKTRSGATSPQGEPWQKTADSRNASALWHMRHAKTPVLILHGENDVRVPVEQAIAFYRACLQNGVLVDMVTYPREGHFICERRHLVDMWTRMRDFCKLHLQ